MRGTFIIWKTQNHFFVENYCTWAYDFYMTVTRNESCMKDFIMNSHTLSIFPAPEINKPSLVGKILWRLDIILQICLIHLFVSLDITAMINILELICKTLHEKMSEVINL